MRKLIVLVLVAAFVGISLPSAQASEVVSRDYIGGLGASALGVGRAVIFCYEPGMLMCDPDQDGNDEIDAGLGGTDLISSGFYSNAVVSIADDVYGTDAAFAPCFYHPEGDFTCDGDAETSSDGVADYPGVAGCGTQALVGAPFESNFVSVFVYAVLITDDLEVCGASTGTATANLF